LFQKHIAYSHVNFHFRNDQLLKRVRNAIKVSCERNPFFPGVCPKLLCLDIWTQVGFWNVPNVNVSDEMYWQQFPCETSIKIMAIVFKYPHIGLFLTIIRWNRVDQFKKKVCSWLQKFSKTLFKILLLVKRYFNNFLMHLNKASFDQKLFLFPYLF